MHPSDQPCEDAWLHDGVAPIPESLTSDPDHDLMASSDVLKVHILATSE